METITISKEELSKLEAQLKIYEEEIEKLKLLNKWYEDQLLLSRAKKFGSSSEKNKYENSDQLNLFNEAESEKAKEPFIVEPLLEEVRNTRNKKSKRKDFTKELPTEVIVHELSEEEKGCPNCGNTLHEVKTEIKKELTIIPAQVKVIIHETKIYTCRNCEKTEENTPFVKAKTPPSLIAKSFVSPSLLSHVINQKFTNGMPLNRQEAEFKRFGINLSKQTMSNWVIKGAELLKPLLILLKKELIEKEVLHADETVLEVLKEPGRDAELNSYMWLYRTSGCSLNQIVIFDYQEGRGGIYAKEFLKKFKGYLHTDGWSGYKQLPEEIILCGCWAHMRRKFEEALKIIKADKENSLEYKGFCFCNALFHIEKEIKELSSLEKLKIREEKSKPITEAFFSWISDLEYKVLPKSLIGTAVTYAKNQKKYLLNFLKDGRIEISNNRAESSIRPFVVGRKNWLFCNTPGGARASALLYSIIQTALANNLKPYFYLEFIFDKIREDKNINFENLLPWSANIPDFCKLQ